MNNIQAIFTGLRNKLISGTALTSQLANGSAIYYQKPPDNADYPFVLYSMQSGVIDTSSAHKAENVLANIMAFGTTNTQVWNISEAVYNMLEGATLTVSGSTNFATMREMCLEYVDTPPDKSSVYSSGGLYRIRCD